MTVPVGSAKPRFDFSATLPNAADLAHVHFVAIGGSGMSGVATLFLETGMSVTGSDLADTAAARVLRSRGVTVFIGHDEAHVGQADVVVVSGAVPQSNPEVVAARQRGVPVLHRAQAIAVLSRHVNALAIAGTNGKTTTSAMTVAALTAAGSDPGFVIGSALVDRGVGAALGPDLMVIEADESDGSFVTYRPQVGVVTNVMPDHLDFYGTFAAVQQAYVDFVDTIDLGGVLVSNADDPASRELAQHARGAGLSVATWGHAADADVRLGDIRQDGRHTTTSLRWQRDVGSVPSGAHHDLTVPLPGMHNVHNAAAALLATVAGYNTEVTAALGGLASFAGTARRFERVGACGGVEVIDDYAHNPPKVAAVVAAGRCTVETGGRLVVVFQPHLYSRTRDFAAEFARGLKPADVVIVLDVYGAREASISGVSGMLIVEALRVGDSPPRPDEVHYVADLDSAAELLCSLLQPGDVVLTVGAGDITTLGPRLLTQLEGRDE